jgi:Mg/Co/Ni transporter MgtE
MTTEADRTLGAAYLTSLPLQAARALEAMEPADAATCLESFDPASVAAAVSAMRPGVALAALSRLPDERARRILTAMEPTAATAVLRLADATRRSAFLEGLEGKRARQLKRVAGYPVSSAGAWCDPMAPVWAGSTPAGDVAEAVRKTQKGPHDPICVIRDDGSFLGCARITDIVSAPPATPVQRLVVRDLTPVLDTAAVDEAVKHEGWLDFAEMPVIDRRGRFVGKLSRRKLLDAVGELPRTPDATGDDLITGATSGTASWLGVILEAVLSRRAE